MAQYLSKALSKSLCLPSSPFASNHVLPTLLCNSLADLAVYQSHHI